MNPTTIKSEPIERADSPEGLLPDVKLETPFGFEDAEWAELTEGFATEEDEIDYVLSQRGGGASRQGRPTNLKVGHKGPLSFSARAVQQRDRAARRDTEEKAIESAKASDRAAKYQQKKKRDMSGRLASLAGAELEQLLKDEEEELAELRFQNKSSAEWLTVTLDRVHTKWDKIRHEQDLRKHARSIAKLPATEPNPSSTDQVPSAMKRLYGYGGVVQKLIRDTYTEGHVKLMANSFRSLDEKKEWQKFVEELTPEELALVRDQDWTPYHPSPPPELHDAIDVGDAAVSGDHSDECEEEEDRDSEIDAYYNGLPNEYESDSDKTDFFGFSDSEAEESESVGPSDSNAGKIERVSDSEDDVEMNDGDVEMKL